MPTRTCRWLGQDRPDCRRAVMRADFDSKVRSWYLTLVDEPCGTLVHVGTRLVTLRTPSNAGVSMALVVRENAR